VVGGLTLVLAVIAALAAILVVLPTDVLHSAIALIVVLLALAGIYAGLGAWFIAAIQVIVYAGAIMVLFMFTIMVLESRREHPSKLASIRLHRLAAVLAGVAIFLGMAGSAQAPVLGLAPSASVPEISMVLFNDFLLPFELVGVLLLVAVVGVMTLTGIQDRS
jgi:NADH-quinone oxidoreductase subunit J